MSRDANTPPIMSEPPAVLNSQFHLMLDLTDKQTQLAEMPLKGRIFLEGPAGSGKTTAAIARLTHLVSEGVPGHSVMILVPQLTLSSPYAEAIRSPEMRAGGQPTVLTLGGLARRTAELYRPMLACHQPGPAHC